VSFSSAETRWAPMLGGYQKNSEGPPNTRERERVLHTFRHSVGTKGDNESPGRWHKFQKSEGLLHS
jgi:hypothetical protein